MASVKQIVGLLVLTFLAAGGIYVALNNEVRVRVDADQATFYVFEGGRWLVSGVENNKLYNGSSLVTRTGTPNITTDINMVSKQVTIKRTTLYKSGATIIDTYIFDGTLNDRENFPLNHSIEILNGYGLIYEYRVDKLIYVGNTTDVAGNTMTFGRNMKIVWDNRSYFARIFESGTLRLRYRPDSNDVTYNIRLFDPSVALYSPADGTLFTTSSVNLTWNGTGTGTLTYYLYIDNKLNASTTNQYYYQSYPDGFHHWWVMAGNTTENSTLITGWRFGIDTTAPTITPVTVLNGGVYNYSNFSRYVNVTVTENNIKSVKISINGGINQTMTPTYENFLYSTYNNRYISSAGPTSNYTAWVSNTTGQYDEWTQVLMDDEFVWTRGYQNPTYGADPWKGLSTNITSKLYRQNGTVACQITGIQSANYPSIYRNTIYLTSDNPNNRGIFAYNTDNCAVRWKFNESTTTAFNGISQYDQSADAIYVGTDQQLLYSIYSNGTKAWSANLSDCSTIIGSVFDNDTVYTSCTTGSVNQRGLWATWKYNGTAKWAYTHTGNGDTGAWDGYPMVVGDTVYLGLYSPSNASGNDFVAVWTSNGTMRWTYGVHYDVLVTPAYHSGSIWFSEGGSTNSGDAIKLNAATGALQCVFDYQGNFSLAQCYPFMISSPIISGNGLVYFGSAATTNPCDESWIFAVWESNCTMLWNKKTGRPALTSLSNRMGRVYGQPAMGNGQIIYPTDDWYTQAIGSQSINYSISTTNFFDLPTGSNNYTIWVEDNLNRTYSSTVNFTTTMANGFYLNGLTGNRDYEIGSVAQLSCYNSGGDCYLGINASGYGDNFWSVRCHQETATSSSTTGNCTLLTTGSYSHTASGPWWTNPTLTYDTNWGTEDHVQGATGWGSMEIIYPKPVGATSSSIWWVNFGNTGQTGLSIQSSCWNYNTTHLRLRIYEVVQSPNERYDQCYDGSWQTIRSVSGDYTNLYIYEEKMIWNYNNRNTYSFTTFGNQFKFSDGNPWKNFSANGVGYITLDKNIALLNGTYNISWTPPATCTQETATTATDCGGLATGSYSCSGSWDGTYTCANVYDGNWGTAGSAAYGFTAYLNVNYTKPLRAVGAYWHVEESGPVDSYTQIPDACFNAYSTTLSLRIQSNTTNPNSNTTWYCWNGASWAVVHYDTVWHLNYAYEEAILWNMTSIATVDFGDDGYVDLNITGYSSGTQYSTNQTTVGISENVTLTQGQKVLRYINIFKYTNFTTANITLQGFINSTTRDTETSYACTGDLTSCPSVADENWETYDAVSQNSNTYPPSCTPPSIFTKEWNVWENYTVATATQTVIARFKFYQIACYGGWGGGPAQAQVNVYIWNGTVWEYQWSNALSIAYAGCTSGTSMPNITLSTRTKYFNDNLVRMKVVLNTSMNCGVSPASSGETRYYEASVDYSDYPSMSLDLLNDGVADYTNSSLNAPVTVELNRTLLNSYLASTNCDTNRQNCIVPLVISSTYGGLLKYSNLNFMGTYLTIPLNTTSVRNYLNSNASATGILIPVRVNNTNWGTFNITAISIPYNGTIMYNITVNNGTNYYYLMGIYWSNYSVIYRTVFKQLAFTPASVYTKNSVPYGQVGILSTINITLGSYSRNATIGVRWNNTQDCVDFTISNSSSKANGFIMSGTGQQVLDFNTSTLTESKPLYYWLDLYSCPSGVLKPSVSYISCCKGCISCW